MLNKLRLWIIKKLLKDADGYTFTGFSEEQPIKFYYCEDNGIYYLGKRSDNFYYARPTLGGWSLEMSRYLPWGKTVDGYKYKTEPKEIEFKRWIYGILGNVHEQYVEQIKERNS